jgi:acetyl-CoA synthetase
MATATPFTWEAARQLLDGLPGGGGLNIAHEAVDRHAAGPLAGNDALRWVRRDGRRACITFAELRRDTNRVAHALRSLGVVAGDVVATLLGRVPEQAIVTLAR